MNYKALWIGILCAFILIAAGLMLRSPNTTFSTHVEDKITHKEIVFPAHARPIGVQCGNKPCVVFFDPDKGAVVALMVDGSTITVRPKASEDYSK